MAALGEDSNPDTSSIFLFFNKPESVSVIIWYKLFALLLGKSSFGILSAMAKLDGEINMGSFILSSTSLKSSPKSSKATIFRVCSALPFIPNK